MANKVIRAFGDEDAAFLEKMLYNTIYVPSGQQKPDRSILKQEMICRYYENFGRKGDLGFVAEFLGEAKGMVWCRLFDKDRPGYGYVDEVTPELSIAISPSFRGHGIGTELMLKMLEALKKAGYEQVSLSTDCRNPSVHLYQRLGFKIVQQHGDDYVMVARL